MLLLWVSPWHFSVSSTEIILLLLHIFSCGRFWKISFSIKMSILIVVNCHAHTYTKQLVGKWTFCTILYGALFPLVFRTMLRPDGSAATYFTPVSTLNAANRNITFCLSHCVLHLQELLTVSGLCQDWALPLLLFSGYFTWSLQELSFLGFFLKPFQIFWIISRFDFKNWSLFHIFLDVLGWFAEWEGEILS